MPVVGVFFFTEFEKVMLNVYENAKKEVIS